MLGKQQEINDSNVNEEYKNNEYTEKLKNVMAEYETEELPYRCISFYAYLFVLIIIGIPIWWFTTTPYRASLESFDIEAKLHIPLSIRIYYDHKPPSKIIEISKKWLENEISPFSYDTPLQINYRFEYEYKENLIDFIRKPNSNDCSVELVLLDESEFVRLNLNDKSEILITHGRYIVSMNKNVDNFQKIYNQIRRIIYEEVLDINRLSMIMQREKKNEQQTEIKSMAPEKAVWEDISISPKYNVHIIFIHDEPDVQPRNRGLELEIINTVNRLANLIVDTTHISIGWEHFWDFGLKNFLKQEKKAYYIPFSSISDFVTEVDRYSAAIEEPNPTFKLVVIFSEKNISMVDEGIHPANSIAVASWGGILSTCTSCQGTSKSSNAAVLDVLRSLLGVRKTLSDGFFRLSDSANDLGWQRLRLHAFVENYLRARHYVRAIHQLTSKISDLVISDEVADLVKSAIDASLKEHLEGNCVDTYSSAKARIFAERAANHPSLLEYLNFPWGQKYAIYLPLFFPVLLPTLEGAKTLIQAWLEQRKQKSE